jgi:nucleoside-diphosphate-sugar epimerase
MTKVLVTGGAGYLGSVLVPALLERGCSVAVVDNFMYGQDSLAAVCYHPDFSIVRGDVRSIETMKPLVKDDKVEVERTLLDRHPSAISLRLATVFGMSPRMRLDLLVNDFTYRAYTDRFIVLFESHFKRNFIHVRDVARAFLHAMDRFDDMKGQIYNVGLSDANLSKLELCQRIQKHLPGFMIHESNVGKDPDKRDYIVSNEKIERTGYKTAFSLDAGIQELIKGFAMIRNTKYSNI